ncbi:uncharacterized protein [Triticum aestivum]|uniref:uncharacterized protein isoform X3 n=1 Tax=Triticum aestivum TaxID=4565 RepID=UPI0003D467A0|nr:uncharacterized protein LOC123104276 isoform X3 [Triticum aestivum]XP_044407297.1 uncharacterized protein LOC123131663 isoform X4 [Triticum aestivum]
MGAETNLSSPQLDPTKSRESVTLLNDDQGSVYVAECDKSLEPAIGMVVDKWETGEMFYTRCEYRNGKWVHADHMPI